MVPTVVDGQAEVVALPQAGLVARTRHVVQEDGARAITKETAPRSRQGRPAAQLPAHHLGGRQAPEVVAHGPPGAVVLDLHAALAPAPPVGQPHHVQICRSQGPSWREQVPLILKRGSIPSSRILPRLQFAGVELHMQRKWYDLVKDAFCI